MRFLKNLLYCLVAWSAVTVADTTSLDLPDIGDSTGTIMSPEYERRLGQAFLNQVRRQADVISDPEVESYIRSVGYRLVSHSDRNTQQFTFFIIQDPLINAFAAPGGIVGVNSGVVINASDESELAAVMAHEVSHVTQKHMARSAEMQAKLSLPMMAAMLGAILVATQNPEAGKAAIVAVQGGMAQAQINFTRSNEQEADTIGMQLLERSGFDPHGMPDFFAKLQKTDRYFAQAPDFLRSHPVTTDRIADSEARADAYPHKDHYDESRMFRFIRAKLIVQSYKDPQDAIKYFNNELDKNEQVDENGVLHYGLALAKQAAGDPATARDMLKALLDKDPENSSLLLASAKAEMQLRNNTAAYALYEKANRLYPDYRPLVLEYSEALLQGGNPTKARDLLKKYGKLADPDFTYYEYLARAEAESGNPVESGIANAEYYYLTGETRVAIERLKYILREKNPTPDYYQQERVLARLAYFEQELKIEKDLKLAE